MKKEIICGRCGGTGTMPMPEWLSETLALIPRKSAVTTADIGRKIPGVTRNAQNNRLECLRLLGFVSRERRGKFWLYRKTSAQKQPAK